MAISIVYDVKTYRKLLAERVKKGYTVIEIGPHKGASTKVYANSVKLAVLVDKSTQAERGLNPLLRKFQEKLVYVKGDVRDFKTIAKVMKITGGCDLFAIDMGGGRYPDTVFKVWAMWSGVFKPKHSIIRNRGIAEFLQRGKIEDAKIKKNFSDNGWLSEWGRAVPSKLKEQFGEFEFWVDM